MTRRLCWVSCGAASAVATKLDLADHPNAGHLLLYTDPGSEHPDNRRFLADLETWFGRSISTLRSAKYADTWQVWNERRYLNGPAGALCTVELKKKLRQQIERADDVQVFGYTVEEAPRAERFRQANPDVNLCCPLIDRGLTKSDCLAMIERAGIAMPAMYLLGFQNNNCIGCVKGGRKYWSHIRRHFPFVYRRMANLERELNASCINGVFLDELADDYATLPDDPAFDCSLLCVSAEIDISEAGVSDERR